MYGERLHLIDSGLAVARQTARVLIKHDLRAKAEDIPEISIQCFVSGHNSAQLLPVLRHMLQPEVSWSIHDIVVKVTDKID